MRRLKGTSILIVIGLFLVFGAVATSVVNAQDLGEDIPIRTEVVIPGSEVEKTVEGFFRGKVGDLAGYLDIVYTFLISIVGVVAGFSVMVGGYQYLTAGGDAGRVQAAKKRIGNAIIGLVLALGSFTLLNTINPALVNLKVPSLDQVKTELGTNPWCEVLRENGASVTVIMGPDYACGSLGKASLTTGETVYCIYHGDKGIYWHYDRNDPGNPVPGRRVGKVCLQGNYDTEDFEKAEERAKTLENPQGMIYEFGIGTACYELAPENDSKLKTLNLRSVNENTCDSWMKTARTVIDARERPDFATYCGWSSDKSRCIEATVSCKAANENFPDTGGAHTECDESLKKEVFVGGTTVEICQKAECGGYDDSPEPMWWKRGFRGPRTEIRLFDTLDDTPLHLFNVCKWNPCKFNMSRGECNASDLTHFVPGARAFTSDCRNK